MISDLRRQLISILKSAETATDAQLLERARYVMRVNATLWDLLSRSRTPVLKPWAAVGVGAYIVERPDGGSLALWTVIGRFPGAGEDTEITLKLCSPTGEHRELTHGRSHEVTVFEPSPLAS